MRSYYKLVLGCLIAGAACSSSTEAVHVRPPLSALEISSAYGITATAAAVHDPEPGIRYVLHVTNGSDGAEQIQYGACWGGVRLYASEARSGTPVFDWEGSGVGNGCIGVWNQTTIPQGGAADLVGYLGMSALASAGVPPGHYFVSVVVAPNGSTTEIAAGEVDVQP